MTSYINPKIELIPDPVGIDAAVQGLQERLAELPWLEKAFGRATLQRGVFDLKSQRTQGRTGMEYVYPEVYNKREPINVMINDNLKAYCFFHLNDPQTFTPYGLGDLEWLTSVDLSVIFWVNLQKIDPTKNYNFTESLRIEVMNKLKSARFVIRSTQLTYDRIFAPYTITETFRQFLKPPYSAFRIDGTFTFDLIKTC